VSSTLTRHRSAPAQPTPSADSSFLPGVQALRAIAALLVVTFHLWPGAVPGGFAGVDVFFVISGFLITGHIARETQRSGRVHLVAFYARRVKRLFPAALTVLAACVAGTVLFLPLTLWQRSLHEILASALYFENWALASSSVDYFAAEEPPTAAQHYWSLSVEEQFYIVWPLLFLLVAVLLRRWQASQRFIGLAVPVSVLAGSFAYSVLVTGSAPGAQYFNTFSRAWEFAAGGVLALTLGAGRLPAAWSRVLLWGGLAMVIGSGFYLNESMRFPGWIAILPVLGTVAAIAAGTPGGLSPSVLVRHRAVQFTGGISYSLYLWHWPLIIFFGREPGAVTDNGVSRWLLLAASVVLAIASTYLIENPVRKLGTGRGRLRPPQIRVATLGLGALAMAAIVAATHAGQVHTDRVQAQARAKVQEVKTNAPACLGAASLDPALSCAGVMDNATPVPDPVTALDDRPKGCMQTIDAAALRVCSFGASARSASLGVAMVGDSHAMHWMATMQAAATKQNWHLVSMTKGSCPFTRAVRTSSPAQAASCTDWNASVLQWLRAHPEISQLVVSASSLNQFVTESGQDPFEVAQQGFEQSWAALPSSVRQVVVLRDIPRPRVDVVDCAQLAVQRGQDVAVCSRPRAEAELRDPQTQAAERFAAGSGARSGLAGSVPAVSVIDLNDYFCTASTCSPGVGGAFVYRDSHHMTATYGRTLTPYLLAALPAPAPAPR
jgi:peptidoglycan/LPS O-acetylase OafA/YrhL